MILFLSFLSSFLAERYLRCRNWNRTGNTTSPLCNGSIESIRSPYLIYIWLHRTSYRRRREICPKSRAIQPLSNPGNQRLNNISCVSKNSWWRGFLNSSVTWSIETQWNPSMSISLSNLKSEKVLLLPLWIMPTRRLYMVQVPEVIQRYRLSLQRDMPWNWKFLAWRCFFSPDDERHFCECLCRYNQCCCLSMSVSTLDFRPLSKIWLWDEN